MTEYIDRKEAIKAIESMPNCYNGFSDTYDKACIIGVLEELPAVTASGYVRQDHHFPHGSLEPHITNADRIRAMTDEELAELVNSPCPPTTPCVEDAYGEPNCKNCWLEWLKEEVDG